MQRQVRSLWSAIARRAALPTRSSNDVLRCLILDARFAGRVRQPLGHRFVVLIPQKSSTLLLLSFLVVLKELMEEKIHKIQYIASFRGGELGYFFTTNEEER